MSVPILTAEQRLDVFEEARMIVGDNHNPVFGADYDQADRREHVKHLRDAISTLDAIGWDPAEQAEPLHELNGADREALDRFASNMEAKWQESLDDYERDAASPRRMVGTAQAMRAALNA